MYYCTCTGSLTISLRFLHECMHVFPQFSLAALGGGYWARVHWYCTVEAEAKKMIAELRKKKNISPMHIFDELCRYN